MTLFPPLSDARKRTLLDIVAAAMILSVAVALAGLTWRIAGHAGTGAITVPGGGPRPASPAVDVAPALALAPFGQTNPADAAQPTQIAATLKGVFFARPESMSRVIIQVGEEKPREYAVGQSIAGAQITAILRDRAILNNGGRAEYLALPDPFAPSPGSAAPAAASPPPAGQSPMGTPSPAATAGAPDAARVQAILSKLQASPVQGGYAVGAPGLPGLKPGDVIRSINRRPLGDAGAAREAMASALQRGSADVEIQRDGQTVTVTVPLQ
ncbi:type II secretion system protein N [Sphingomonas sp. BGYR3]|uniref:type II secretion system protein N n=1 Tax=Sphingomonas sp. BGYR3 TaxID=2975483 RepID=UPI0021A8DB16|nr:type II secretion system protein N [Sphingomonas sp. BGYR3]MDG5487181.1 type II secretion system protein N [Sphingomonas sp. BGYR3]